MFKAFTIFIFSVLLAVFTWAGGFRDMPVKPSTIPEYDYVAGVIMYWNPYSNYQYDQIAVQVINGIQSQAKVYLQTNDETHKYTIIEVLQNHEVPLQNIVFLDVYGARIWIRDHGPFSIYDDEELAFVGFNDFASYHGDKDLTERLAEYWDLNYYGFMHIIFDGGNYMVDSHGQLFATDRLYTNNPAIPQEEIDSILYHYMNIEKIHTFRPMTNDYWGHLDMQIKLLNDTTFIISTVDENHPDYDPLEENYQTLLSLEHPEGKEYQVHKIPKADNWKTYINSLIVNDVVLVPVYDHINDIQAIETYETLLPEKTIIGINCNAMIGWGGAIHCVKNQIPPFVEGEDYETFAVEFKVKDGEGNPITNAIITLGDVTNNEGDYIFEGIEEGTYKYKVEKYGYITVEGLVFVNIVDGDVTVDIIMEALMFTVTFDITDEDGSPVTEAVITFGGEEYEPGYYVFENIKMGTYEYKVEKDGYVTVEDEVVVEDDITVNVTMYVETFTVNFKIYLDGEPVPDAVVTFDGVENPPGDYLFEGITAGIYDYKVEKEGYYDVTGTVYVFEDVSMKLTMIKDKTHVVLPSGVRLKIFPNPARNKFTVESSEMIKQVRLINIGGQIIKDMVVDALRIEINVRNLQTGVYVMQIHTANNMITERIQVLH